MEGAHVSYHPRKDGLIFLAYFGCFRCYFFLCQFKLKSLWPAVPLLENSISAFSPFTKRRSLTSSTTERIFFLFFSLPDCKGEKFRRAHFQDPIPSSFLLEIFCSQDPSTSLLLPHIPYQCGKFEKPLWYRMLPAPRE